MPEKLVTKGLVLRQTQTGETDNILTVLTAERGQLPVIARGARRRNSHLAAASELLAYSELVVYERRGWYLLDEASTIALWDNVRQDVERLSLASYFAELAEAVTGEDMPAPKLLSLLLNILHVLNAANKPLELLKAVFELKLLAISGYEPLLSACAICGTQTPEAPLFDPAQGVVFCRACAGAVAQTLVPLDTGALAAMRHVLGAEKKRLLSFSLYGGAMERFARACERFIRCQLARDFRALDFYKAIRNYENPEISDQRFV